MLWTSERKKPKPSSRVMIVVVAAVSLLALVLPAAGPLYARVYPGPGSAFNAALADASLHTKFVPHRVTQFDTARFTATLVYGTPLDPKRPTVKVAWSNVAELVAEDESDFVIERVTSSRQYLNFQHRRPGGGYSLSWTWDVTPMVSGKQRLTLRILPTVVIGQRALRDVVDVNEPIPVVVEVHPAQREFNDVLAAAKHMKTDVPRRMTVGKEYDVSASMSLAGHDGDIGADIALKAAEGSADLTISEKTTPQALLVPTAFSPAGNVVRHWTVVPDEPGGVRLVFTATVTGRAADTDLKQDVAVPASARAVPSFWDILQKPVVMLTSIAAVVVAALSLLLTWKKHRAEGEAAPVPAAAADTGEDDARP